MSSVAEKTDKRQRLENILTKIIANNDTHARWMNLLSYLEFIGSRKIFKTQKNGSINEELLKHASDEARHALVLKQMIGKLTTDKHFDRYDARYMMGSFSGYRYIQNLDSMVKKRFQSTHPAGADISYVCYVYVSYVIEVRANWLYDIYAQLLTRANSTVNVSAIINDEVRHLHDMTREIGEIDKSSQDNVRFFLEQESLLFERFLRSLEKIVSAI